MADLHVAKDFALPLDLVVQQTGILARTGAGKRLAINTPLPTPSGWTTMADVQEGDRLFDERGWPCAVTYISPIALGDAYRIRFSDGSNLVADDEHLWLTLDRAARRREQSKVENPDPGRSLRPQCQQRDWTHPAVRSTREIRESLICSAGGYRNHSIRVAGPLRLENLILPIDPYTLGVWLGDGSSAAGCVTVADKEILQQISDGGYEIVPYRVAEGKTPMYGVRGLQAQLRSLHLLNNKHIPAQYLRAAEGMRLWLLQGLMDSDGGWSRRNAEFSSTNALLADDVYELIVSLGMQATRRQKPARFYGKDCGIAYTVSFVPRHPVFRLPRKADKYVPDASQRSRREHRFITAVEPVEPVPMRCIAVNSPNQLYLAGESMIPTHNTNAAVVIVEEVLEAGQQVCILDPPGAWHGLRSSADGERPGYPIVVLGGNHGDLPLESSAGATIADFVVDEKASVVLDLSEFTGGEIAAFVTAFSMRLYHRKGKERDPMLLVIEEADEVAPQRPMPDQTRMLGAVERIVKRGRMRGIGTLVITQRSASLNKNVLSQIGTLVAMQTTAPQDIKAIDGWIERTGDQDRRKELLSEIAQLPIGTAFVWSPAWLRDFRKVHFRRRHTFDSSATPKPGQQRLAPKKLADVDLEGLRRRMVDTIERAKADDPRELQKRIRELERQLRGKSPEVRTETIVERVEVLIWDATERGALQRIADTLADMGEQTTKLAGELGSYIAEGERRAGKAPRPSPQPAADRASRAAAPSPNGDIQVKAGARRMLQALASHHPRTLTRVELATLAGMRSSSGTYNSYLSTLRRGELIDDSAGPVRITDEGFAHLGLTEPPAPQTPDEIQEMWRGTLKAGARAMFDELLSIYPQSISRQELAERVGMALSSGTFGSYLSTLRRNNLMEDLPGGELRATDALFLEVSA